MVRQSFIPVTFQTAETFKFKFSGLEKTNKAMSSLGDGKVRVQRETDSGHLQENSASKLSRYNFQNTRSNSGLVGGTLSLDYSPPST